jgi:hypothetical protein
MKLLIASIAIAMIAIPVAIAVAPSSAAAALVTCGIDASDPCEICDIFGLFTNIINQVLFLYIPLIAPIFLIIGGFYILTAAGNPNRQSQGKSVVTAVVIGLIIIYTAWVAISTILTFLGVFAWTGLEDWWIMANC